MKQFHHSIQTTVIHQKIKNAKKGRGAYITWWQLCLIGISSVIGAGFFLGTGLSIHAAGASVLISYLIAGISAFFVIAALAEMMINDPGKDSFRAYAKIAYGEAYSFMIGWTYWFSGLLIVSSEITALSTFSRYWLPHVPIWIFFTGYALIGVGIILLGIKDFGTIESFFAVAKSSALIAFILFIFLIFLGVRFPWPLSVHNPIQKGLFPNGFLGFWSSMIYVLLSFGGINIIGLTAKDCRHAYDVVKAGYSLILALVLIYLLSITAILMTTNINQLSSNESPFIKALAAFHIPFIGTLFNLIIVSAAFSTMVGALYSMTTVLASLASVHDAPKLFGKRNKKNVPVYGLFLTLSLLVLIDILSYLLPKSVYAYLAAAAGIMLLLNWLNILVSDMKNRRAYSEKQWKMPFQPLSGIVGLIIILFGISGSLIQKEQRFSLIFVACIMILILIFYRIKRHLEKDKRSL